MRGNLIELYDRVLQLAKEESSLESKRGVSRRYVIKNILFGTILWSFSSKFDIFNKTFTSAITVDTSFYSLKFPRRSFDSVEEFWKHHSSSNSNEEDLVEIPYVASSRERVYLKICESTGNIISRVIYRDISSYLVHTEYLKEKYSLKVSRRSAEEITYCSKDFLALDSIYDHVT